MKPGQRVVLILSQDVNANMCKVSPETASDFSGVRLGHLSKKKR